MVDPPALPHHEVEPLSANEARALIAAMKDDPLESRWLIGLSLGLRQGEVLRLWWEDIDLDAGTLRVRRQLVRRYMAGGALEFAPLKTARSARTLSLPRQLVDVLRRHRVRQNEARTAAVEWADPRLVFATASGKPIDHRNDTRSFKQLIIRADVRCGKIETASGRVKLQPRVRLHDLRHTAASLLLAQGVPARVLMEMLGHSQIGITMNTYSHVMPAQLTAAADAMTTALWGNNGNPGDT